jgi:hypothetical protein
MPNILLGPDLSQYKTHKNQNLTQIQIDEMFAYEHAIRMAEFGKATSSIPLIEADNNDHHQVPSERTA